MKTKELIQRLRDKDDQLCSLATDELEKLLRRYEELGRSYDAMSNDLFILLEQNGKLRTEVKRLEENS